LLSRRPRLEDSVPMCSKCLMKREGGYIRGFTREQFVRPLSRASDSTKYAMARAVHSGDIAGVKDRPAHLFANCDLPRLYNGCDYPSVDPSGVMSEQ